jgi:hypothetical protein
VDAIVITRKLCKRHNIVLRNGPFSVVIFCPT